MLRSHLHIHRATLSLGWGPQLLLACIIGLPVPVDVDVDVAVDVDVDATASRAPSAFSKCKHAHNSFKN